MGRSSGHRETPSIAIVLYDCHVSTNIGVSHHTSGRYNGIPFKVWRPNRRLVEAARTILREASQPIQTLIVTTERLNVRAAPNINAHILRKLPRNATVTVLSAPYCATDGSEWRELKSTEGQGNAPSRAWVCVSQRGTRGRRQIFLQLAA